MTGEKNFNSLISIIKNNETCEQNVRDNLIKLLDNWNQEKGFRIQKTNKDNIRLLLEQFLLKDRKISRQVILTFCVQFCLMLRYFLGLRSFNRLLAFRGERLVSFHRYIW